MPSIRSIAYAVLPGSILIWMIYQGRIPPMSVNELLIFNVCVFASCFSADKIADFYIKHKKRR